MNITDEELKMLEKCQSEDDWNDACTEVKRPRNGQYPSDWYPKVLASGLMQRVAARFGGSDQIKIIRVG